MGRYFRNVRRGVTILAKYDGTCVGCGSVIIPGTPIVSVSRGIAYHESCYNARNGTSANTTNNVQADQASAIAPVSAIDACGYLDAA